MKMIKEVEEVVVKKNVIQDVEGEGFMKFLGERITLFCVNYFYTGRLIGVNKDDLLLTDAAIVYETGPLDTAAWKDAQKLPHDIYIRVAAIEAYGKIK